ARFLDPLPDVGFCFDPGHAALMVDAGVEGATEDPEAWRDAVGQRLALLHAMDYVRTEDGLFDHLVPGAGAADQASILQAAQDAGCQRVLLEAFFRAPRGAEADGAALIEGRTFLEDLL
ncbi:MAG: TIM barrel protein, partial [Candidatus Thermoplasmatota archaeon]|nr:TIM barrel protein [Candidatus Thermoplasmatota archaeon]